MSTIDSSDTWEESDVPAATLSATARWAFLAEASDLLAASLEYQTTLQNLAFLAVPRLADWCAVDVLDDRQEIQCVAVAHRDPAKAAWARELFRRSPPSLADAHGTGRVIRTGQTEFYPRINDSILAAVARTAEELHLLRRLGFTSSIVVPMRARSTVIGTLTLVTEHRGRRLKRDDMALALELGRRAAMAVEHAQLYQEALEARARAERLQAVTAALSTAMTPEQVGAAVIETGLPSFGADAGSVFALSADGGFLELLAYAGYAQVDAPRYQRVPVAGSGPLSEAVRSGKPVIVESAEELVHRWPSLAGDQERSGDAATIATPLMLDGQPMGVLYLAFRRQRLFGAQDLAFLATLAQQCTQALERARLYRQARDAVRLRDQFISIASHELKNPLTVLLGNAELLMRRADRSDLLTTADRHMLAVISEQAKRQRRLIDRLLDFSRLQSGQFSVDLAPLPLRPLLERILQDLTPGLEHHIVRFVPAAEPLVVQGDELRLEQVVTNLLSNAAKYSPDGTTITLSMRREQDSAVIEVGDRGPGISLEERERIFEPFYRAPQAGTAHVSGSGIGLYVVSQIVAHHGGTVSVESGAGGTTFQVRLPLNTSP